MIPPTPRPAAHRAAAQAGTTTLAISSWLLGSVKRRSSAVVIPNGGFATTLNGRRGKRRSDSGTVRLAGRGFLVQYKPALYKLDLV